MNKNRIIKSNIDVYGYEEITQRIISRSKENKSTRVHAANVHMVMEGYDEAKFQSVINTAEYNLPDGMPLVWALKLLGNRKVVRVYGPTLMLHICEAARLSGIPIGLYGGTPESLKDFQKFLVDRFSGIKIACVIAPPFRPLTQEEDNAYTQEIIKSSARILFVGIGCPKQEWWMYNHRDSLPLVMVGVGAAFDFHSGRVRQSPAMLQRLGLEWLFRFAMEPKRLWKRYVKHNPRFLYLIARHIISSRFFDKKGDQK